MSYIDKVALQDIFLSENDFSWRDMMATVDKDKVDQDIREDGTQVFHPFLSTYEVKEESKGGMTPDDHDLFCDLHGLIQGSKMEARRALKKLQKLRAKYPLMPSLYNFIGVAYKTLGQDKKYYYTIKTTCKKFPDYIFGKFTLAEYKINQGHYEDVSEVFNQKLQLYMHYPAIEGTPTFHASEVQAFYTVVGRYYARNRQIVHAIKCYFLAEEAESNSPHLDILAQEIVTAEMASLMVSSLENLNHDS